MAQPDERRKDNMLIFLPKNLFRPRIVLVHVHIFKNAGSTFDWILSNNFADDFVDHRNDTEMIEGGAGYLRRFLRDRPSVKAVSSHHIYFNPACLTTLRLQIMPVYILRHPIERTLSVYKYERQQASSDTPGAIKAKETDFNDYIAWRMESDVASTILNNNAMYCAGHRGIVGEKEYRRAIKNIEKNKLVGIVDRFEESMQIFAHVLREYFPDFDPASIKQNVNQPEDIPLAERVKNISSLLDHSVHRKLYDRNRYDMQLYTYANKLLDKRLAEI